MNGRIVMVVALGCLAFLAPCAASLPVKSRQDLVQQVTDAEIAFAKTMIFVIARLGKLSNSCSTDAKAFAHGQRRA